MKGIPKRIKRKGGIAISLFLALGLWACMPSGLIWTGSHSFPSGAWSGAGRLEFRPDSSFLEKAAGESVAGVISLRYSADADVRSIPLIIEREDPAIGDYHCDTVAVSLLPKERRTAANGRLGVFESADTLFSGIRINPGWALTVHPDADSEIKGIYSITFEIIKKP